MTRLPSPKPKIDELPHAESRLTWFLRSLLGGLPAHFGVDPLRAERDRFDYTALQAALNGATLELLDHDARCRTAWSRTREQAQEAWRIRFCEAEHHRHIAKPRPVASFSWNRLVIT
ncbi:MAG: hypothetical protein HXX12_08735 [Geothrix sp.]|uniref:hypothetical protein n=1 Tax=Geothrix sp. TaxID=1962974 RepID=UPI0017D88D45|nr:hypothetical protein [Geothrix sp.]NWJ41040.1 hypothetical protein [Geothrix sp.]WIL20963.1 MAG: hypothetical protein QOZ81_000203 [Geothrix sp.]